MSRKRIQNVRVEQRPDGNYNVTMTGSLAEGFLEANRNLESLLGRKISEAEAFGPLLDRAISLFEAEKMNGTTD